jgi:hypothetical protein
MLSVIYVECHLCLVLFMLIVIYVECHLGCVIYAECHLCLVSFILGAFYTMCRLMLSIPHKHFMLSLILLNFIMKVS